MIGARKVLTGESLEEARFELIEVNAWGKTTAPSSELAGILQKFCVKEETEEIERPVSAERRAVPL